MRRNLSHQHFPPLPPPSIVFQGGLAAADESCNQKVIIHGYLGALQLSPDSTTIPRGGCRHWGDARPGRQWRCFILISLPMPAPYSFFLLESFSTLAFSPSPPRKGKPHCYRPLSSSARPACQFSTIHTARVPPRLVWRTGGTGGSSSSVRTCTRFFLKISSSLLELSFGKD